MAAINKEFLLQLNLLVLFAIMRQQKKLKEKTPFLGKRNFSRATRAWRLP